MADFSGPGVNGLRLGRALILIGPPGAGKGTQARAIAKFLGVPHISTGDMFRELIGRGSPLGEQARPYMERGDLVPDEIVFGMVEERVSRTDCANGFILDGFPRTVAQADKFDEIVRSRHLQKPFVMHFVVDKQQLLRRLTGRRTCSVGGEIYNIYDHPPKVPGRCDNDGGELIQRPDDREEIIIGRLATYEARTRVLVDYYRRKGTLVDLDGMAPPAEVTGHLLGALMQVQ
ncbi:MAG TPA: adenylate kinase [Candidatus Binataceae bacterium]|nr:adenylate kinase [Candidatus Binataceae bacterium]